MKDLIDHKNFIEKSSRSIVKGYNAHFVSEEELEEMRRQENAKAAREQYIQLRKEEERKKEKEKEALRKAYDRAQDEKRRKKEENMVTEEQIDKLLGNPIENQPPGGDGKVTEFVTEEFATSDSDGVNDPLDEFNIE